MSTVKISELPVLSSADAADEFVVVDDSAGVTKKITFDSLATDVRSEAEPLTASTVTASGLVTASAGINFGSDTLDDYEEGTFSPTFFTTDGSSTITYVTNVGEFVRVGNLVHVEGEMDVDSASGTLTNINIGNLPYVPQATEFGSISIGFARDFLITTPIAGLIFGGLNRISLRGFDSSSAFSDLTETATLGSTSRIMFGGTYYTS